MSRVLGQALKEEEGGAGGKISHLVTLTFVVDVAGTVCLYLAHRWSIFSIWHLLYLRNPRKRHWQEHTRPR